MACLTSERFPRAPFPYAKIAIFCDFSIPTNLGFRSSIWVHFLHFVILHVHQFRKSPRCYAWKHTGCGPVGLVDPSDEDPEGLREISPEVVFGASERHVLPRFFQKVFAFFWFYFGFWIFFAIFGTGFWSTFRALFWTTKWEVRPEKRNSTI